MGGADSAGSAEPTGDGFPVTIAHKFDSTEITGEPERALSLGYQEHDAIFALGVTPVAVR